MMEKEVLIKEEEVPVLVLPEEQEQVLELQQEALQSQQVTEGLLLALEE